MGRLALDDMLDQADNLDLALSWHLASNCFPPVTFMHATCKEAIILALGGELDTRVDLPDGVMWRNDSTAPVWAIIEGHHLESFLEDDNDDSEV